MLPAVFLLQKIKIVLVETTHSGNIGAVARAMKNMSVGRLVLVNPVRFPCEQADARSAGAVDILRQAQVVSSLPEAIKDCDWVLGSSARSRKAEILTLDPEACARRIVTEKNTAQVALVFGREDRGLTNEELSYCHFRIHIPANPDFSSLNLGAAVQVVLYELRKIFLQSAGIICNTGVVEGSYASAQELADFYQHLQRVLKRVGFEKANSAVSTLPKFQALYNRARPTRNELAMLRGVLSKTEQALEVT